MARFRGTVKGLGKGEGTHQTVKGLGKGGGASRLGSKASGLVTNANGWDVGVRVEARVADDKDTFDVYLTGGSNGGQRMVFLGTFDEGDLGRAVRDKPPSERDLNVPELVEGLEASGLNVITIDEDTDFSKLPSLGKLLGRKEEK